MWFLGRFLEISWNLPGNDQDMSRIVPEFVREISRTNLERYISYHIYIYILYIYDIYIYIYVYIDLLRSHANSRCLFSRYFLCVLVITRHHGSFEGRHLVEILPTGLPELSNPKF